MAYIIVKQPKPFTCLHCGSIFTIECNIHSLSTSEQCPVCGESHNTRTDKSPVEIAKETIDSFADPHITHNLQETDLKIVERFQLLKRRHDEFVRLAKIDDDDTANYFFPETGSHPCYEVFNVFVFTLNENEYLEFGISIEDDTEPAYINFWYKGQAMNATHNPFAQYLWTRYFESEYDEIKEQ